MRHGGRSPFAMACNAPIRLEVRERVERKHDDSAIYTYLVHPSAGPRTYGFRFALLDLVDAGQFALLTMFALLRPVTSLNAQFLESSRTRAVWQRQPMTLFSRDGRRGE